MADGDDLSTLTMHFSGALRLMIDRLAQWQGLSLDDVVRKAITDEYFLQERLRQGEKILLERKGRDVYRVNMG